MSEEDDRDPAEALAHARAMSAAGAASGHYSRTAALVTALWAGAVAGLMVAESGWWFVVGMIGVAVYVAWQRRRPATLREVGSKRDLGIVLALVIAVYSLIGLGFLAVARGVSAAPLVAGLAVAVLLYGAMHMAYNRTWTATG